ADTLVNRLLRIEEAVHVRRAHMQLFGDVANGRLLVAELAEQALRHPENPFPRVRLHRFGNQGHISTQSSLLGSSRPILQTPSTGRCSIIADVQSFSRGQWKYRLDIVLLLRREANMNASAAFFKAFAEPERI